MLVRPCLGLFIFVPTLLSSSFFYYFFAIILVSAPSSSFILAVPMREVYCVRYIPRAWDPRSLQSILDVSLIIRSFATSLQ